MTYELPDYQRRMMGYDQPGGFRSVASSYTGALLTVGTQVHLCRCPDPGTIVRIEEASPDGRQDARVRVSWHGGSGQTWEWGRSLMRVGRAR